MQLSKNTILVIIAVLAILVTGVLIYANQNPGRFSFLAFGQSDDALAKKAVDYLNKSVLSGGSQASLESVSEESGLVKIKIKIATNEYDSYITKDGKLLFPQAFKMETTATTQQTTQNSQPTPQNIEQAKAGLKKSDSPVLEAFVVSRCPFGLQMQRVMADIVKNIPDAAKNMEVRYIGSVSGNTITSMHGDAEAKENLRQICIREEQPAKYWDYVACQMKNGDTAGCEKSTGIDSAKLNACTSAPSRGIAYAKADFDLASKNNVQGSPTLVLADSQVSEFNFGGRSSEAVKTIICSAYNSTPSFCSTKLNTAEAATSFSAGYADPNSGSAGNSGATGAGCAPAQPAQ